MKSTTKRVCTFCRKEFSQWLHQGGEWHTAQGAIHCCHQCAIDVLPRLMADSVHIRQNGYVEGGQHLEKANGNFWKGMVARLSSRGG